VREYGEFGAELNTLVKAEEHDLRRLLAALRQTAENLENLTDRARQDPPRLLFSAPPRKLAPGEIEP
jgi:ABC-type transporter Mla subunit MlaD